MAFIIVLLVFFVLAVPLGRMKQIGDRKEWRSREAERRSYGHQWPPPNVK